LNFSNSLSVIDTHSAGHPIRIITSGIPHLPGDNMMDKMNYMKNNYDWVRTCTMFEPRGHRGMMGAVITEPTVSEADFGVFYMESLGYEPMSGASSISVGKTMVETGMVPAVEPVTTVVLDAPAGLVRVYVSLKDGEVIEATLENVTSFLYKEDVEIIVPDFGKITVDLAYGGNFFAFVDAEIMGIEIKLSNINMMIDRGMKIIEAVNKVEKIEHPVHAEINSLLTMFYNKKISQDGTYLGQAIFGNSQFDRSPCGTGTCARMAYMHAKGLLKLNEEFTHRGAVGTILKGVLVKEDRVGPINGVVPRISGKAHITGFNQFVLDKNDDLKMGIFV